MTTTAVPQEDVHDAHIVIVDDEPLNAQDLADFLRQAGHTHVVTLTRGEAGTQTLREECADLVLLDLEYGHEDALALLRAMQADRHLRHVPVLGLCTQDDHALRLQALALGAVELLVRPVHAEELTLRLRNALLTKAYRDRLAHTDPLTGLPNRDSLLLRTDWALKQALRHGHVGAVLHLGLDRFQQINNALGPGVGDELLHAVAARLSVSLRDSDTLARHAAPRDDQLTLGPASRHLVSAWLARGSGDEFTVLLPRVARVEDTTPIAQRLIESLQAPFDILGHELYVSCRIGMAVFPGDSADRDTILQHAGVAMRSARRDARVESLHGSAFQYFSVALHGLAVHRLTIERELRHALMHDELRLFYQPQVDLATGAICGAEALVRWQHPRRGLLGPGEFITIAEETGQIGALGRWVLHEALRQWSVWFGDDPQTPRIGVNVSGLQLQQAGLFDIVRAALAESRVRPQALCLELTETAIIDSHHQVAQTLKAIRALGVQFALDDFGTGYSSLTYLRRFDIDELKIDRSFMAESESDGSNGAITAAIVVMARRLGLRVVAEGVETQAQLDFIRAQGAHSFQGYLFSKPLAADAFADLLARTQADALASPLPA